MFKNQLERSKKIFFVKVGGYFKEEEASQFLEDYMAKYKSINPKEYELILDCKDLIISAKDMVPVLKQRLEMYASQGFKKIYLVKMSSPTAMLQLQNVGKEVGFWDVVTVIDSASDVDASFK